MFSEHRAVVRRNNENSQWRTTTKVNHFMQHRLCCLAVSDCSSAVTKLNYRHRFFPHTVLWLPKIEQHDTAIFVVLPSHCNSTRYFICIISHMATSALVLNLYCKKI